MTSYRCVDTGLQCQIPAISRHLEKDNSSLSTLIPISSSPQACRAITDNDVERPEIATMEETSLSKLNRF